MSFWFRETELLSILGVGDLRTQEEQAVDLSPEEVNKFIEYVIMRIDVMVPELNKLSKSTNDALLIHHIERTNSFLKEGKWLLEKVRAELNSYN